MLEYQASLFKEVAVLRYGAKGKIHRNWIVASDLRTYNCQSTISSWL
jgi:hypothetical protein